MAYYLVRTENYGTPKSTKAMTKQMAKIAELISKPVRGSQKWRWYYGVNGSPRTDDFVTGSDTEAKKVMNAVKKISDAAILTYVWEEAEIIDEYESENLEKRLNERQSMPVPSTKKRKQ